MIVVPDAAACPARLAESDAVVPMHNVVGQDKVQDER